MTLRDNKQQNRLNNFRLKIFPKGRVKKNKVIIITFDSDPPRLILMAKKYNVMNKQTDTVALFSGH